MKTLQDCFNSARQWHQGQTRVGGEPYVNHVERVARQLGAAGFSIEVQQVGVLHDILEDTHLAAQDLVNFGCPFRVVEAVEAISRKKCGNCLGQKRIIDMEVANGAVARIEAAFPQQFTTQFLLELVSVALDDVATTKHCPVCNGGGWGDTYSEYLAQVAQDPIAITVKRYDAWDNFIDDARPGMKMKYWGVFRYLRDLPGIRGETVFEGRMPPEGHKIRISPMDCPWRDDCSVKLVDDKRFIYCSIHERKL